MSNLVEQIANAMESEISGVIGAGYAELDYKYDVTKNDFFNNKQRYGVIPQGASTALSITKVYTLDHSFEVILTHDYINKDKTDSDQRRVTYELFDKLDDIFRQLYRSKAGLPNIVLNIPEITIAEPEFFEDESLVVLRAQLLVTYRNAI